jgi:hypothetical protein
MGDNFLELLLAAMGFVAVAACAYEKSGFPVPKMVSHLAPLL